MIYYFNVYIHHSKEEDNCKAARYSHLVKSAFCPIEIKHYHGWFIKRQENGKYIKCTKKYWNTL
jgi:hypothetical protein